MTLFPKLWKEDTLLCWESVDLSLAKLGVYTRLFHDELKKEKNEHKMSKLEKS